MVLTNKSFQGTSQACDYAGFYHCHGERIDRVVLFDL